MESNMKSVLRKYLELHGDGRHLENFLRRNSYSSDERETTITTSKSQRNKTKSLESLKDTSKDEAPKKDEFLSSSKIADESKSSQESPQKPMEQSAKVVVKQSGEKLDKKKSNKFNYESIIEITLPPPIAQPQQIELPSKCQVEEEEEKLEEPITPILSAPSKPKSKKETVASPSSHKESMVSNKQNANPLEWDSFMGLMPEVDAQQQNLELCNPLEFGENEMNALKTYFQSVGLRLPNENLVVLIKNRKESTIEREKREFEKVKETKDKWLKIYEKYREKYSTSFKKPEAHSTPKIQESLISEKIETSSEVMKTPPKDTKHRHQDEKSETFYNHTDAAESFEFVAGSKQNREHFTTDTESSLKSSSSKVSESTRDGEEKKVDEISNFDDSLKVAIALLNSLLEARNMKPELKRNLAGKVIQKIVQIQTSRSIQTSTLESSGFYPISNSSTSDKSMKSIQSVKTKEVSVAQTKRTEEAVKKCFEPSTHSEKNYSRENSARSQKETSKNLMEFMKREKTSHLKWIEKEIEHLKSLRELLSKNDSSSDSIPIYENLGSLVRSKTEIVLVPKAPPLPDPPIYVSSKWNSHANNRKTHKTRGKLQTPVTSKDGNIADLIYDRNKKLVEKYQEIHKVYEEINVHTRSKSAPISKKRSEREKKSQDVQTSTSLASSVFDTKSNKSSRERRKVDPNTHMNNVETQTSDTIYRTKPIFETKEMHESDYYEFPAKGTVKRVQSRNDKRTQARPPSIKYTLSFDRRNRAAVRPFMSLPTNCSEENSTEFSTKSSKNKFNTERSAESGCNKENEDANLIYDDLPYDDADLKSCFNTNRPDTFNKFEERKRCIDELKKLRALRNEQRNKLLLLTSDKSLKGKLFSSLPELPLRTRRIFSTRELKLQTQRKIKSSSEFKQRKAEENVRNIKRKNRLMTKIFNKNLQKEALRGNLNLSNTANLISYHR